MMKSLKLKPVTFYVQKLFRKFIGTTAKVVEFLGEVRMLA